MNLTEDTAIKNTPVMHNNWNLLSPQGRLNRKSYILIIISLLILSHYYKTIVPPSENLTTVLLVFSLILVIYLFTICKRLKDIGWSRWFTILTLVPYVSYIFLLILACNKSKNNKEEAEEKFSWDKFKNQLLTISSICFYITYVIYGLIQLSAIYAGALKLVHNQVSAFLIATFTSYIPLVGTCLGIYGAHIAWQMSWIASILLFIAPYLLFGLIFLLVFLTDTFSNLRLKSVRKNNT